LQFGELHLQFSPSIEEQDRPVIMPPPEEPEPRARVRDRIDEGDLDQLMVEDPAAFERILADRDAEDEQPDGMQ
jgi:hypothetical protein